MKGDFSRDTFNLKKNFRRVLMQQGRVQLDADWNEQSAILLDYIQTLAADLIGPHAAPVEGGGFEIGLIKNANGILTDLSITPGRYYVNGILCNNDGQFGGKDVSFFNQPHRSFDEDDKKLPQEGALFVYLDVWERHVTSLEDASLAEVALNGIDTASRSQVVWQVRMRALTTDDGDMNDAENRCRTPRMPALSNALLIADVPTSDESGDPCSIAPDSRYRGVENQLYRVEIHTGNVDDLGQINDTLTPTFKWSRENGSVVFPIISITGSGSDENATTEVRLAHLGRDDKFGLREGDWVEIVDDGYSLENRPAKLLMVSVIDRDEKSVTLKGATSIKAAADSKNHALLRRWDQKPGDSDDRDLKLGDDNAALIVEGRNSNNWLTLEDGIQIQFVKPSTNGSDKMSSYHRGDYWLIPARTATGDIEWLLEDGKPQSQLPSGIKHHYAPLGIISDNELLTLCRCTISPVSVCPPLRASNKTRGRNT